jgi:hypothetical protein
MVYYKKVKSECAVLLEIEIALFVLRNWLNGSDRLRRNTRHAAAGRKMSANLQPRGACCPCAHEAVGDRRSRQRLIDRSVSHDVHCAIAIPHCVTRNVRISLHEFRVAFAGKVMPPVTALPVMPSAIRV